MCGFVALINTSGLALAETVTRRMLDVIAHRGPDDAGHYFADPVAFGFRRLSILDLSPAGHQPMSVEENGITIVFNGEIYNYLELHAELVKLGHRFRSRTDTEVILHAYLEWGDDCVSRFNGMWAFLIHDRQRNRVFGSRDRFGMKPLFMHQSAQALLLASEIKSILASGLYRASINLAVCAKYLHHGLLDDTTESFYAEIRSIPPGHNLVIDASGHVDLRRYWRIDGDGPPPERPAEEFAELFEDAVRLHLRSDVPLGVNLSGGLDSTSILCAIARNRQEAGLDQALKTFCFEAREYDESPYIAATIAQTHAERHTLRVSARELWDSLPTVMDFQDEPVHTLTAVVSFHLSRLAAEHGIKVVLNGQGADETLAGYGSYFRDYWYTLASQGHLQRARSEIGLYTRQHGDSASRLFTDLLAHVFKSRLRRLQVYRSLASHRHHQEAIRDTWFAADLTQALPRNDEPFDGNLNATLKQSVEVDPLPLYLRLEDRNAMAHSIESRLPFLDPRLVAFAFRLSPEWKIHGPWNKYVLRQAMTNRIPDIVRNRPDKMGFPTPFSLWLKDILAPPVLDSLQALAPEVGQLVRVPVILKDLEQHRAGIVDISDKLFRVLQLNLLADKIARANTCARPL